ncbi:MAG: phosphatase PAP2 family protein, partial [Spirochaetaceae bacterium]|nr:phosphatase PAP2 family protein [Spirochaetaceae bacterium]
SLAYNYGLNFISAGLETWGFIETGIDWRWRNTVYDTTWLPNCAQPGLYIGYIIPALAPAAVYTTGRLVNNEKLQIAGLALMQSLMLTLAIQTPLKMITGRYTPGLITELDHDRNPYKDNFSGKFNWFNGNFIAGWPSGHTANAFAAAATLAEIYKDNVWLKVGVYSYAALIGFGVTLNVHWASDALAGALIGYAVGKTVGKSFSKLLDKEDADNNAVSLYITPNALQIVIRTK